MENEETEQFKRNKFISILRLIWFGSVLALTFTIGLVDRFILVFMVWKPIPNLFSENYYRSHFVASYKRVLILALLIGLSCLIKFCFY